MASAENSSTHPAHRRRWPRVLCLGMGVLVVALVIGRLLLPSMLRKAINQRLNQIPAYQGHVDDIGVSLFRGAYTMHGLQLDKRESGEKRPFLSVESIDFSLAWKELVHRRV